MLLVEGVDSFSLDNGTQQNISSWTGSDVCHCSIHHRLISMRQQSVKNRLCFMLLPLPCSQYGLLTLQRHESQRLNVYVHYRRAQITHTLTLNTSPYDFKQAVCSRNCASTSTSLHAVPHYLKGTLSSVNLSEMPSSSAARSAKYTDDARPIVNGSRS